MKKIFLLLALFVGLGSVGFSQSPTQIKKKCPSSSIYASAAINALGDININPCPGRSAKVNGSVIPNIQTAVLTTDFSKTNDTLTAVTGWDKPITLVAGHWYRVTLDLVTDNAAVGSVADFAGGAATATGVSGLWIGAFAGFYGDTIFALDTVLTLGGGDSGCASATFTMQVNAGGTLIPRFAQGVTNVAASTLKKYSTITALDITP